MVKSSTSVIVHGIVQGVGFRPFIYRSAVLYGLNGYVKNRGDAVVEIALHGDSNAIEQMINQIKHEHPKSASIEKIEVNTLKNFKPTKFQILKSTQQGSFTGSTIPPDISICKHCIKELENPRNRRYRYFFITCTECGPRFTIIKDLPYDRENTSMNVFNIDHSCLKEYKDPLNRRFHAQTIACGECGPSVELQDTQGNQIPTQTPIEDAGKLVEEGNIVAIKGNGGYHVAASVSNTTAIEKLRIAKHRVQKPFAIMGKDVQSIKKFAYISTLEEKILSSPMKPILLLRLKENNEISSLVSPGLAHIGVMLPYTGLHVLLFRNVQDTAFILTSANPPNEPIIIKDNEAMTKLNTLCDYFLIHNRHIVNRCDDSVLKIVNKQVSFLRRSRGYVPLPIPLTTHFDNTVLGIGSDLNNTVCVLGKNKAFLSQHIGDIDNFHTLKFLKEASNHLTRLTNLKINAVACDLHPTFHTTRFAEQISKDMELPLIKVPHHYAHASKLMAENNLEQLIAIVCDGYGYGLDGTAWGGEIILGAAKKFERIGCLQQFPLIGADLATSYPLRLLASILFDEEHFPEWFLSRSKYLPYGSTEANLILQNAREKKGIMTSSCGRLLDAISSCLEICFKRTYEGEPAIKLEAVAKKKTKKINLPYLIKDKTIITEQIVKELFRNRKQFQLEELAYAAQTVIADALAAFAIKEADRHSIPVIGFTGGVAYNDIITSTIGEKVLEAGYKFVTQKNVPCGDGGISFGQSYYAQQML